MDVDILDGVGGSNNLDLGSHFFFESIYIFFFNCRLVWCTFVVSILVHFISFRSFVLTVTFAPFMV